MTVKVYINGFDGLNALGNHSHISMILKQWQSMILTSPTMLVIIIAI